MLWLGGAAGGADCGDNVHQGFAAFDAACGAVDDGEEHQIVAGGFGDEPGTEIGAGGADGIGGVAMEAFGFGAAMAVIEDQAMGAPRGEDRFIRF